MLTVVKNQTRVCLLSLKYNIMREMVNKVTFLMNIIFMMLNNACILIQWFILFRLREEIGGYTMREIMMLWGLTPFVLRPCCGRFPAGAAAHRDRDCYSHGVCPAFRKLGFLVCTGGDAGKSNGHGTCQLCYVSGRNLSGNFQIPALFYHPGGDGGLSSGTYSGGV